MRNVANQQGWVVMLRTQSVSRSGVSVLVLVACCSIGPSVSVSKADGIDDDLAAVARTGPGGRGSVAAGTASWFQRHLLLRHHATRGSGGGGDGCVQ